MRKVLVFGTFDVLHPGHKNYIQQARRHGDYVVAVVARDATTSQTKGRSPLNDEKARLRALKDSGWVDAAVLGRRGDKYKVVIDEKPDVICFGYDQTYFTEGLSRCLLTEGLKPKICRMKPFKPDKYKSSLIRRKLTAANKSGQRAVAD